MKRVSSQNLTDEAQAVGADVVPRGVISTEEVESEPRTVLSDWDYHLFNEGSHHRLWEKLGAHLVPGGAIFGVWAPNAASVSVIGDWNGWDAGAHPLESRGPSGIWEGFVPDVAKGMKYKFRIEARHNGHRVDKADPFGVHHETSPHTGSI